MSGKFKAISSMPNVIIVPDRSDRVSTKIRAISIRSLEINVLHFTPAEHVKFRFCSDEISVSLRYISFENVCQV